MNRVRADRFVEDIKKFVRPTLSSQVLKSTSGYASLYALDKKTAIAASTDGVGTKLKLAFELNTHHTVGIDLVAMSVNDLVCVGARPLFFLDYLATGKLKTGVATKVLAGVADGCRQAGCALVGGETAEMPGLYSEGEYDLAGFAVGTVDRKKILPHAIRPGDTLIGFASSGFHSNGYSLLRRLVKEEGGSRALLRKLLHPTRIYVPLMNRLMEEWGSGPQGALKGAAHITGSGILNLPRISTAVNYEINWPRARDLPWGPDWLLKTGRIKWTEAFQTFNMGVGMILAVRPSAAESILKLGRRLGFDGFQLGQTRAKEKKQARDQSTISLQSPDWGRAQFKY